MKLTSLGSEGFCAFGFMRSLLSELHLLRGIVLIY
jgi:hypothetical protein